MPEDAGQVVRGRRSLPALPGLPTGQEPRGREAVFGRGAEPPVQRAGSGAAGDRAAGRFSARRRASRPAADSRAGHDGGWTDSRRNRAARPGKLKARTTSVRAGGSRDRFPGRPIERGLERDANAAPRPPARPGAGPAASAGHLCLQDLQANAPLLHALHEALTAQGIAAGTLVSEYGPGQFEVNLTHGPDPLRAADEAALLRRATHGVAASQGLRASFMAKPYAQKSGSGLHVHVSLVDAAGRNRFGAERGQALLEHAVAGMQALHAESMAIFAPSFSAYRRYKPGAFVAAAGAWAENSRAAAFRIPPGGPASRRIEHRIACADASPHLTMAAILAALHHGITRQLTPTQTGPGGVPNNIFSALDALERSTALAAYLPPRFPALFAALKRAETAALLENIALAEWDYYL